MVATERGEKHSGMVITGNLLFQKPEYYPRHLAKLADIPQFHTWMKNRLGHLADATITGAAGEDACFALTFDGTYIWAGLDINPFKILKINPVDNTYTVITGAAGENRCRALTFDGTYIWAGLSTSPFKILKINPVDNTYTVITGAAGDDRCRALTFDSTYIWAGLFTNPVKILKINPVDNTYTVITGAAGEEWCWTITFDGTYVWAGLNTVPAKILKINPVDNTYTVITGAAGEDMCHALTFDGTYIWAGLDSIPAKVLKINPADNSYITINLSTNYCNAVGFDGTYIWAATESDLSQPGVYRINPADNTFVLQPGTIDFGQAITFDGTYLWIGYFKPAGNPFLIQKIFAHQRKADLLPYIIKQYAAGTPYSLTATPALLDFGTTDPIITLDKAGTYLLKTKVNLKYNGATFGANQTVTLKLRRTNNTAADISNSSTQLTTGVVTTITETFAVVELPDVIYTTSNDDDIIQVWGDVDVIPSVGSLDAVEASIIAQKIS